ncbi:SMI1/KNR4 family protein [Dactylosporangium sp. CA-233914]|uniref:SMI1/KNR4 family protein n=1 Tax=Dactylosporangium sp. CA-233914 TaxID=3239934 RepID=UPI003D9133A6
MHLTDTLTSIEDWLRANAPATAAELGPPATDEDLDALRRGLGLPLPGELVTLLRWHNGGGDSDLPMTVAPSYGMLGTRDIVSITESNRRVGGAVSPPVWQPSWLAAGSSFTNSYLVVETADPAGAVFTFTWTDGAPADHPTWPSLAEALATMLHTLQTGESPAGLPVEVNDDGYLDW